ncbi:MAG: GtrA family protein [Halarcobacter sp.]
MKIIKYFFVGGTAAVVDVGLFFIFAKFLSYNYLVVGFFTFIIATFVNYYLSIKFVFESGKKFKKHHEIFLIYIVSATSLVLNLFLLYCFHDLLKIDVGVSKIIVTGLLFFYNYSVRKFLIFQR